MSNNLLRASSQRSSVGKASPKLLLLAGAVILVATVAGVYVMWSNENRDRAVCHSNALFTAMHLDEYLNRMTDEDAAQVQVGGDPPLIVVSRAYSSPAYFLVCPTDNRFSMKLKLEDLTEDLISYRTWSWPELMLLRKERWADALILWEKRPNHRGKRQACTRGASPRLVDETAFQEMMAYTKGLLEESKARAEDPE